jgi:hypothetical protein
VFTPFELAISKRSGDCSQICDGPRASTLVWRLLYIHCLPPIYLGTLRYSPASHNDAVMLQYNKDDENYARIDYSPGFAAGWGLADRLDQR